MNTLFKYVGALSFVGSLYTGAAAAAPGDLDPSFGQGGTVAVSIPNLSYPSDIAVQPDGKILLAASYQAAPPSAGGTGLIRFLSNGTLDPNFHGGRPSLANLTSNGSDTPQSLALQADGRSVVLSDLFIQTSSAIIDGFGLARYNEDGSLDRNFGLGGKVVLPLPNATAYNTLVSARVLLVQPDGKMLIGARVPNCDCQNVTTLIRLTARGGLDRSFGTNGMVSVSGIGIPTALALLSNGNIVVRNSSGQLEFNTRGESTAVVSTSRGASVVATAHSPGRDSIDSSAQLSTALTVPGDTGEDDNDVSANKHDAVGQLDNGFIVSKFDYTDTYGIADSGNLSLLQDDGRVVVAGLGHSATKIPVFGIARLNTDGALDNTFATGGKRVVDFNLENEVSAYVFAMRLQPDGNIVMAGTVSVSSGVQSFAMARVLGN